MVAIIYGADRCSFEIRRKGEPLAFMNWHADKPAQLVFLQQFGHLTVEELEAVLAEYVKHRERTGT